MCCIECPCRAGEVFTDTGTMACEDDAVSDSYSLLEAVSSAMDERGAPLVDEVRLLDSGLRHGSLLEHVRDGRLDIVRVGTACRCM